MILCHTNIIRVSVLLANSVASATSASDRANCEIAAGLELIEL